MRTLVGGITLACILLWFGTAAGQRLPEPTTAPNTSEAPPSTNIPVKAPKRTEVLDAEEAATSSLTAAVALEQPVDPDTYLCGPGDTFELNFWGQQNFRLRVAADLEGRVFISKVGFVRVTRKTLTAVRAEVNKKVRRTYPGLMFELMLVSPRTFLVHVVDNIRQPGVYEANPLERVSAVLSRAGGSMGSRRRITIERKTGKTETVDLVLYELTGDTKYNPFVLDGDVIKVPFTETVASIGGAVRRPGSYELVSTRDLAELLQLAGGLDNTVVRSMPIQVVRRNETQRDKFMELSFVNSAPPNLPLQDDDRVYVRGSDELQRSIVILGVFTPQDDGNPLTTSRRLPYVEGDTLLSLIDRAGGIKTRGDLRRAYITRSRGKDTPEIVSIDLEALLVRRDFSQDKPVSLGDMIVIPPMQYNVSVEGAVGRPGAYPYNPVFGVPEYIARAGGRTRSAVSLDDVRVIGPNGKTTRYRRDLLVTPGDAILVAERNWSRAEIVQLVLAGAGLVISSVALTYSMNR